MGRSFPNHVRCAQAGIFYNRRPDECRRVFLHPVCLAHSIIRDVKSKSLSRQRIFTLVQKLLPSRLVSNLHNTIREICMSRLLKTLAILFLFASTASRATLIDFSGVPTTLVTTSGAHFDVDGYRFTLTSVAGGSSFFSIDSSASLRRSEQHQALL